MTDAVVVPVAPISADLAGSTPHPVRWTPLGRFGFRLAFCYLLLYAFGCGNATLWEIIPKLGDIVGSKLDLATRKPAEYLAQHQFHIVGVGAHIHDSGSGDTAINWIQIGVMLAYAVIAAIVWSLLDRRRLQYQTAAAWLRFLLRLTLVYAMCSYGFAKLFPLQMMPPSLAVLNEPLGNTSPMTLLWTLIGLNPVYEMICGAAEVTAALLLLFRRTALVGALLTGFVMVNVLLYNLFFDVPVKIYAAHLVLMAIAVTAPDLGALWDFFWRHKPSAPHGIWVPPAGRRAFRWGTVAVEGFLALMILLGLPGGFKAAMRQRANVLHPKPFSGEWHVDSAVLLANGKPQSKPILTGDGLPMTDLFLEPSGHTMLRDSSGVLWRARMRFKDNDHSLQFDPEIGDSIPYAVTHPDPAHMTLTPTGKAAASNATLQLTRVALPTHYPLLDRGFHAVNEWGLER